MAKNERTAASGQGMSIREEVAEFKRQKIMDVALDLFYTQGFNGTTIDMVAQQLGKTKPFVYQYFPSKVKILESLCLPFMEAVNNTLNEALALDEAPSGKLLYAARNVTRHTLENQRNTSLYFREEHYMSEEFKIKVNSLRKSFDRKLRMILEEGIADRVFDIDNVKLFGLTITGMINWTFVWYNPEGPMTCDEISSEIARHCLQLVQRVRSPA